MRPRYPLPDEWLQQGYRIGELAAAAGRPIHLDEFRSQVFPGLSRYDIAPRLRSLRMQGWLNAVRGVEKDRWRNVVTRWEAGPVMLGTEPPRTSPKSDRPPLEHGITLLAMAFEIAQRSRTLDGEDRADADEALEGAIEYAVDEFFRAIERDPRLVKVRRAGESAQRRRQELAHV